MSSNEASNDTKATFQEESPPLHNKNDFVIREGFPALLRPDGKGPLIEGEEPLPSTKFASYKNALHVSSVGSLLEDCNTVFSARTKDDGAAYSVGCTYFVPCQMKPRCALEGLALQIFETQAAALKQKDGLMYDPERSGAEWWTLVMDAVPSKDEENKGENENDDSDENDNDDDDDDDEVGMHFDADYGLESSVRHMMLHPRVATVTYLSNVGAPTVVLDKRSPLFADVEKKSLSGNIKSAWISGPRFGKHMCFDGRLFHGAPAAFFPGVVACAKGDHVEPAPKRQKLDAMAPAVPTKEKRVTFLVNVWINHCPMDAELLEEDVCKELKTPWEPPSSTDDKNSSLKADESYNPPFEWKLRNLNDMDTLKKEKIVPSESDPAGSEETVACHREVTIHFGATMDDLHKSCQLTEGGDSVELDLQEGAISISVGQEVESSDDEEEDEN